MLKVGRDAEFDSDWFTSRYDLRLLAVYQCRNNKQDAEFVYSNVQQKSFRTEDKAG
jgi:hypothetical protein